MRGCSSCSLLLLFLSLALAASEFKICSYNVQGFNQKKASNYRVIHTLTRVIFQYDICLLQHVIDPDGKAIKTLLTSLNRYVEDYHFKSVSSKGLGKSADDMQQYVFIYRTETVNLTDQYQYQSGSILRPPFIVQFQSRHTAIKKFTLVPVHTDPPKAVQEIDQLYDVFKQVSKKWNNTNVMFLGDFHAACAYVTRADRKTIRLYTNTSFSWLIRDKADTTVSTNINCAYDRIVVYGHHFLKGISPLSAKVYNIDQKLKLSRSKVLEVSDHFPVEVKLKSSGLLLQATPLLILLIQCLLSTL